MMRFLRMQLSVAVGPPHDPTAGRPCRPALSSLSTPVTQSTFSLRFGRPPQVRLTELHKYSRFGRRNGAANGADRPMSGVKMNSTLPRCQALVRFPTADGKFYES